MAEEDEGRGRPRGYTQDTRLSMLESDVRDHSRILTELITASNARNIADARREEQDKVRDTALATIKSVAIWGAGGIGGVILIAFANFILSGGLTQLGAQLATGG